VFSFPDPPLGEGLVEVSSSRACLDFVITREAI